MSRELRRKSGDVPILASSGEPRANADAPEARFLANFRVADNSEVFIGASRRNGKNQLDR